MGADSAPCLTCEPGAEARRQSKALNECFLSRLNILKGQKSGQGQTKGQNLHFMPFRLRDGTNNSCEPKLCKEEYLSNEEGTIEVYAYTKQKVKVRLNKVTE